MDIRSVEMRLDACYLTRKNIECVVEDAINFINEGGGPYLLRSNDYLSSDKR